MENCDLVSTVFCEAFVTYLEKEIKLKNVV